MHNYLNDVDKINQLIHDFKGRVDSLKSILIICSSDTDNIIFLHEEVVSKYYINSFNLFGYIIILLNEKLTYEDIHKLNSIRLNYEYSDLEFIPRLDRPGLLISDMDMTILKAESLDVLASKGGLDEEFEEITEQGMNGLIDFKTSFIKRIELLKNIDNKVLKEATHGLPLAKGADNLVNILKHFNWQVAIASGGIDIMVREVINYLGVNNYIASTIKSIENEDGKVIGFEPINIIGPEEKRKYLLDLAIKYNIDKDNTVAIGDGANDILMLKEANLGIAVNAKTIVLNEVKYNIRHYDLNLILIFLLVKSFI